MKKLSDKVGVTVLILVAVLVLSLIVMRPLDSYTYATSGCVGLGTSEHVTKQYSVLRGEKMQFVDDRKAIDPAQFEFLSSLCDIDSETHVLYLL